MKKTIVTTTINAVTTAIERFDSMSDWDLIVIGDLKTPSDYRLKNGLYVSPADQEKIDLTLSNAIGWNCIQRRNFGILLAYQQGADIVALVDDDNIPYDSWGTNITIGSSTQCDYYEVDSLAFDPVAAGGYPQLWHRGFPIQWLQDRTYSNPTKKSVVPDVQADMWDGDPDVDAICRMEHAPVCCWNQDRFPLAADKIAPFNSQNTFLSRRVLRDYFLYPHVGRMDDIWAAYYVQSLGYQVIFNQASVKQERNEHDLTIDFNKELVGYENNHQLIKDLVKDPSSIEKYLPGRSIHAWRLYQRHFTQ